MKAIVGLACAGFLATVMGCSKEESRQDGPAAGKSVITCFCRVGRKTAPITGHAEGPDQARSVDDAWKDACGKLPEAERSGCKDPLKFVSSVATLSAGAGGPPSQATTVTLIPVGPTFEGRASGERDKDAVCREAQAKACEMAGAPGDCVAGGSYEVVGQGSSVETQ